MPAMPTKLFPELVTRSGLNHEDGHRGSTDTWLTPPQLIEALGVFDLDPCAAPLPRPWATAMEHWNEQGLSRDWHGRVWCNPPYGPQIGRWLLKLAEHGRGTALVFARTETQAFHSAVWPLATAVLFMKGRIRFHLPTGERGGSAGAPSVLIAYGEQDAKLLRESGIEGAFVKLAPVA